MSNIVSQTQDIFRQKREHILRFDLMDNTQLCAIDPGKNNFHNDRLGVVADLKTATIAKHIVESSQYNNKLTSYVSKVRYLYTHDAAEIRCDVVACHQRCLIEHCGDPKKQLDFFSKPMIMMS